MNLVRTALHLFGLFAVVVPSWAAPPMFSSRHDYAGLGGAIAVGDVNGDGLPDIVSLGINVLLGTGNGIFRPGPTTPASFANPANPTLADVNGDGNLDLLATGYTAQGLLPVGLLVCLGNGDGTFQQAQFYEAGMNANIGSLAIGDFNRDGVSDVATSSPAGLWLFIGVGDGTFRAPVLFAVSGASLDSGDPLAIDMNGDGKLDIAVQTVSGFAVLLGNGDGTFQPARNVIAPSIARWIHAADVNGDGYPDVFLVNNGAHSHAVSLYLGKATEPFPGRPFQICPVPKTSRLGM